MRKHSILYPKGGENLEQKKSGWRIAMEIIIEIIVLIACLIYEAGAWVITQLTNYAASKPRATAWTLIVLTAVAITGWWPRTTSPEYPSGGVKQSSEVRVAPVPERISSNSQPSPKPKATVVKPKVTVKVPKVPQPKMPIKATAKGPLSNILVILDAGHGGNTPWNGVDPGCSWTSVGYNFVEASYTQRIAKESERKVRAIGGDVIQTNWSPTANVVTGPRDSMPLPIEPRLPNGNKLPNNTAGLNARASVATKALNEHGKEYRAIVFVSLHINALGTPGDWKGMQVCYDKRATSGAPRLAKLMAEAIQKNHYGITYKGTPKTVLSPRTLRVIDGRYNHLRQRVLLEIGVPGNENDSWRLRNEASRLKAIDRVLIDPLKSYAKGL